MAPASAVASATAVRRVRLWFHERNCFMSIKSKVLATAATLTLVGGVGAAGVLGAATANAATPSCGGTCVDIFSQEFGTHHSPNFILDVCARARRSASRSSCSGPATTTRPRTSA